MTAWYWLFRMASASLAARAPSGSSPLDTVKAGTST